MIVYIEQILIDNFIINLLIFFTMKAILKISFKRLNMIFSSVLGSFVALLLPILKLNNILSIVAKIILSLLMVCFLKKYKKTKEFILLYLCFLLVTFVYGGACLFILFMFDKNFDVSKGLTYSLPLGAILLIILFIYIIIKNIFKNFYKRKNTNNFMYKVRFTNKQKTDEFYAFLDTGNNLVDNVTHKPINIVSYSSLNNILQDYSLADFVLSKEKLNKLTNFHTINIQSVSTNSSKIYVFEIDKMEIYFEDKVQNIENACIGLTFKDFTSELNYQALLNPIIFERCLWKFPKL